MSSNHDLFFRNLAQTSSEPLGLEIESALGCKLFAADGKTYFDLISGISVSNIGHNHPEVNKAVIEQVNNHAHLLVYGEFIQKVQVQLAEKLCNSLPSPLNNVYFVNSGAEAVEGALKLAKRYTGRFEILSFVNAYHGSTHGALSIMGSEEYKNSFRPLLPATRLLRYNNLEDLKLITESVAAVVVEPVQAEAGVRLPDNGFLEALRERCTQTGTLLVFDEIQTGFGRTGMLFALGQSGVIPDIILLAKALGGGFPLGAFIAPEQIMKSLTFNPVLGHITTFGGHPVSCAAALAAMRVIENEQLVAHVLVKEKLFRKLLSGLPLIKEIRSAGLLMAVEFDSFEINQRIIKLLLRQGIITDWFLFSPESMRLAPPLVIEETEIREVCSVIGNVIKSISN